MDNNFTPSTSANKKQNNKGLIDNTYSVPIKITEDKIKIIYRDFYNKKFNWGTLFSILGLDVTLLISVLTATFNNIFGAEGSGQFIKYTFIVALIACSLFLIVYFILLLLNRKKYNENAFLNSFKNSNSDEK